MSANLNSTGNETQLLSCSSPDNLTGEKLGKTLAYSLVLIFSLAGKFFIGILVYRKKSMRNPINFLIVNMAASDLIYPIFVFPRSGSHPVVRGLLAYQWSPWTRLV